MVANSVRGLGGPGRPGLPCFPRFPRVVLLQQGDGQSKIIRAALWPFGIGPTAKGARGRAKGKGFTSPLPPQCLIGTLTSFHRCGANILFMDGLCQHLCGWGRGGGGEEVWDCGDFFSLANACAQGGFLKCSPFVPWSSSIFCRWSPLQWPSRTMRNGQKAGCGERVARPALGEILDSV